MELHQLEKRIWKMIGVLREARVLRNIPLEGLMAAPRGSQDFQPFPNNGPWAVKKEDEWTDFTLRVKIPEGFSRTAVLRITTGFEGEWEGIKPQMAAWVDGKLRQGLDTRHTEILLAGKATPGTEYDVLLQAYGEASGPCGQPPRFLAELLETDEEYAALAWDLETPWEAACLCPEGDRDRETTFYTLSDALNLLDLRRPGSEVAAASVRAARKHLWERYFIPRQELRPVAVADCIGHTHIDVAWLWDLHQTRSKAVRSFSTVLELMERYPDYKFMSSQPQLYQFVKEDAPELYGRIQQAVAAGRWETEGGMWVEADCNVTSGESLVRQFLHGTDFFRREFGKDNRILWLPDVFGYSAALPQILKGCGIDYFMTSKISWSEFNKFPYDTFTWKGIDGTGVLSHFTPAADFYPPSGGIQGANLPNYTTYNAMLSPGQIAGGWKRFQQKGVDDHFLVTYGYGDGGGGPTDWMLEHGKRMETPLPGCPAVRQTFAREFFQALEERVADNPRLPEWSGELYLEYHRGTYTAVAKNKRNNRKAELLLREVELWSVLAGQYGLAYPADELRSIWETVLTLQFHDILPGSSIKKVYEDSDELYADCFARLEALNAAAKQLLAARSEGDLLAFNSLAFRRDDVIRFSAPAGVTHLRDKEGCCYPVQRNGEECCAYVKGLAPMTATALFFHQGEAAQPPALRADRQGFDTPFYLGKFDSAMRICSLVEKQSGRELVREGQALNRLVCFDNRPHDYDAWDINIYYDQRSWEVEDLNSAEVVGDGGVELRVRCRYAFGESEFRQDMVLYRDIERIDFETEVDWKEQHGLLKAFFPLDLFYNEAVYDIQFGNLRRPVHRNTTWDGARFEVCCHKWFAAEEHGFGAAILNDCKYGCSADENALALTLLKSSTYPDPDADQCLHRFTYSLLPYQGSWRDADVPAMAYRLNVPVTALPGGGKGSLPSFLELDAPGVIAEAVKQALDGDGVIIRVYECFGGRAEAALKLNHTPKSVHVCNLLEQDGERLEPADRIALRLRPYEICTLRLRF